MNERKAKFADAFFRLNNVKLAALEVGYSEKSASSTGTRLLKDAQVISLIQEKRTKAQEESFLETMNVAKSFKQIFDRCMQHQPVMEYNYQTKMMEPVRDEHGNAVYTFDSTGANRAMENIAKHIGFFEIDNRQKAPVIQVAIQNNYNDGNNGTQQPQDLIANQPTDPSVFTLLPPSTEE